MVSFLLLFLFFFLFVELVANKDITGYISIIIPGILLLLDREIY